MLEQSHYDPLGRDTTTIMRMLTFHKAAGGKSFTRLNNDALRELDLSGLLRLDRAVLFGRLDAAAARVLLNGTQAISSGQVTYVRIVLPVEPNRQSGNPLMPMKKDDED